MKLFSRWLDNQYRKPSGLLGLWAGLRMAQDHLPEQIWTVALMDVQPPDRILEIGFGPGVALQLIAQKAPAGRIAGVDFSRAMVGAALRRNRSAVRRGLVDLQQSDAENLPHGDESFDKVLSIHSIYFWPDPVRVMREIFRVLIPRGRVYLTLLPKDRWPLDLSDEWVSTPRFRPYAAQEVADIMGSAGFEGIRFEDGADPAVPSKYCVVGERLE